MATIIIWLSRLFWFFLLLLGLAVLLFFVSAHAPRWFQQQGLPEVSASKPYVITNVSLLTPPYEEVIADQQVWIANGRVEAIHPADIEPPYGYKVYDAQGAYLLPGLIDAHVHITDRHELVAHLLHGVTTVRIMDGYPAHLRWRAEVRADQWLGSDLFVASPIFHGRDFGLPVEFRVDSPRRARSMVLSFQRDGYDFIKVYSGLDASSFEALVDEAKRARIGVTGHVPYEVALNNYLGAENMKSYEHVEEVFQGPLQHEFDELLLNTVVQRLADLQVPVSTTLATFERLTRIANEKQAYLNTLDISGFPPAAKKVMFDTSVKRWLAANDERAAYLQRELGFLMHITQQLDQAGVPLLAGSDMGTNYLSAGNALHHELRLLQEAGVPASRILAAATINPARALNAERVLGEVKAGKQADLLLVRNNPLDDVTALAEPFAVVNDGQYLSSQALKRMNAEEKPVRGWFLSIGFYLEGIIQRWSASNL